LIKIIICLIGIENPTVPFLFVTSMVGASSALQTRTRKIKKEDVFSNPNQNVFVANNNSKGEKSPERVPSPGIFLSRSSFEKTTKRGPKQIASCLFVWFYWIIFYVGIRNNAEEKRKEGVLSNPNQNVFVANNNNKGEKIPERGPSPGRFLSRSSFEKTTKRGLKQIASCHLAFTVSRFALAFAMTRGRRGKRVSFRTLTKTS